MSLQEIAVAARRKPVVTLIVSVALASAIALLTTLLFVDVKSQSTALSVSFVASLWEDIVFFALVGAAVLFITTKQASDDDLVVRLKNLYSADNIDNAAVRNVLDKIETYAVYCKRAHLEYVIEDISTDRDVYKVAANYRFTFKNMIKSEEYSDNSFPVKANADTGWLGGHGGEIREVSLWDQDTLLDTFYEFVSFEENFSDTIPMKIEPNGAKDLQIKFWIACQKGIDFVLLNYRFTSEMNIVVRNKTGADLNIKPKITADNEEFILKRGEAKYLVQGQEMTEEPRNVFEINGVNSEKTANDQGKSSAGEESPKRATRDATTSPNAKPDA